VACRETKDKRELIRVVRTPEGIFIIDPTGKANGRGAYLCKQANCWEKGLHRQRLAQALRVTLTTEQITTLQAQFQAELSKAK
jgi:hypothetical protein